MGIIGILIDLIWGLAIYLLKWCSLILVSGMLAYGIYWLFIESPVGPYLSGALAILIILSIIGAAIGRTEE